MTSSSSFTIRQLREPNEKELGEAILVLRLAFSNDRFVKIMTGSDHSLIDRFFRVQILAGLMAGEVFVAENPEKFIVGVAVWFGPGRDIFDSEEQRCLAKELLLSRLSPELQQYWVEQLIPGYKNLTSSALWDDVKRNSWHLKNIGVLPSHQGDGVAKLLIKAIREKAEGATLCLETETQKNVPIFERVGFSSKGSVVFSSTHGEFTMWSMLTDS